MNHARTLARDVALLAGSLGDPVQMDIVSRMAAQNFECLPFAVGIARSDPQQQAAVLQMLIEVLGMLVADKPCQCRSDQAACAAGNRRRSKHAEQRASGCRHRKAAEYGG